MSLRYLLDTNIVSYFVRGNSPAVRTHFLNTPIESMAISAVTEAELLFWVHRLPTDTRTRVSVEDVLRLLPSLPWDSPVARVYASKRDEQHLKGRPIATEDLMIAAHAIALNLTLVTSDKAFAFIEGLRTIDWTL